MVEALRGGRSGLRRITVALAVTQLISWGVLYYAFAVVAPDMASQPGWGLAAVSGAFSAGLLAAGLCAYPVSAMLSRFGPRAVMTAGSLLGIVATMLWASASSMAMLYAAWLVMGVASAATLYEPAIVVLALLDSRQLHRTVAAVTVAGGLASTVFVPLVGHLADDFGWRAAVAAVGLGGGVTTAALHARFLPGDAPAPTPLRTSVRSVNWSGRMRQLRIAYAVEQASAVAVTALLVTMLIARGVEPRIAGFVLAVSGFGKVAGRLFLSGRIGRMPPELLAAAAAGVHSIAMAGLLVSTSSPWLYLVGLMSGAAAGTSSVLRPLIVAEHVPLHAFGSASAGLQVAATPARALGPLILGGAASLIGWCGAWALIVVALAVAAGIFAVTGRPTAVTPGAPAVRPARSTQARYCARY